MKAKPLIVVWQSIKNRMNISKDLKIFLMTQMILSLSLNKNSIKLQ